MGMDNSNHADKKKLYFLNQEYQPGMVYQYLQSNAYGAVVGIDVGHGESMAYIYYKNSEGEWVPEPLVVSGEYDQRIPSYIAYRDGRSIVGNDAQSLPNVLIDIKKEPKDWGDPSADGTHTNKDLLRDFIAGLWRNILSKNQIVRSIHPESLLVAAGCPASRTWTDPVHMRSYVELVQEATRCPNVTILPESTAAIMTPIYSNLDIDVSGGVAIYDLGSSTIDFTYILMGKVLFTASIRLGGYDIDKAMLRKIAKDRDVFLDDENRMEYSTAYTKLRVVKEEFYNTGRREKTESVAVPQELDYCVDAVVMALLQGAQDADNALLEMILRSHSLAGLVLSPRQYITVCGQLREARMAHLRSGEPVYRSVCVEIPLDYTVNTAMMKCVLEKDTTVSSQLEPPYKGLSWLGCVDKFFERTHDVIASRSLPCNTVILTGGTSNVTEVQHLTDQYYPGKRRGGEADQEKIDTAASVARGLSLVKGHESRAAALLENLQWSVSLSMGSYYEEFCESFAKEKLFDRVWSLMEDVTDILNDGKEHTKEELKARIQKHTSPGSSFEQQVRYDLRRHAREFMTKPVPLLNFFAEEQISCSERIRKMANEFAKDVYQVQAGSLPELPSVLVDSVARTLDTKAIEQVLFSREGTYIDYFIERITIDFIHPGLGNALLQFISIFQSKLSAERCADMAKTLRNQQVKEEEKASLCWDLRKSLMEITPLREGYDKLMTQQLEVALGIILFELFEDISL